LDELPKLTVNLGDFALDLAAPAFRSMRKRFISRLYSSQTSSNRSFRINVSRTALRTR